jgi:23S rRNA (uracil1939-C5)-methyltransferase
MPLVEAEQREWKRRLVQEALRRLGGIDVEVEEVRPSPRALGYRSKVEFSLGRDGSGRPAVGLHRGDGEAGGLVDVGCCPVQSDQANALLAEARGYLLANAGRWVGVEGEVAEPFRLALRTSRLTGETGVALLEPGRPFPEALAFAAHLRATVPGLAGVVAVRTRPGRRGGARCRLLAGRDWLPERLGRIEVRLPLAAFSQVNPEAADGLIEIVRQCAEPVAGRTVWELYGGVGAFGMALATDGALVTVCEADEAAVESGIRAARGVGLDLEFVHSAVARFLATAPRPPVLDLVVANPPRAGLGPRVAESLARLSPRRLVLVSCDPATLGRDARSFRALGFTARRAIPVDLFPQTAHVETVLTLSRE